MSNSAKCVSPEQFKFRSQRGIPSILFSSTLRLFCLRCILVAGTVRMTFQVQASGTSGRNTWYDRFTPLAQRFWTELLVQRKTGQAFQCIGSTLTCCPTPPHLVTSGQHSAEQLKTHTYASIGASGRWMLGTASGEAFSMVLVVAVSLSAPPSYPGLAS